MEGIDQFLPSSIEYNSSLPDVYYRSFAIASFINDPKLSAKNTRSVVESQGNTRYDPKYIHKLF